MFQFTYNKNLPPDTPDPKIVFARIFFDFLQEFDIVWPVTGSDHEQKLVSRLSANNDTCQDVAMVCRWYVDAASECSESFTLHDLHEVQLRLIIRIP